jgi:hypothetical protein
LKPSNTVNEISLLILWLIVAAIAYATVTGWIQGKGLAGGWGWITSKFSVAAADSTGPSNPVNISDNFSSTFGVSPGGGVDNVVPAISPTPRPRPGGQAGGPQF